MSISVFACVYPARSFTIPPVTYRATSTLVPNVRPINDPAGVPPNPSAKILKLGAPFPATSIPANGIPSTVKAPVGDDTPKITIFS